MELRPGQGQALVDTPDGVLITGAPAGGRVVVDAALAMCGQSWACTGEYVADQDGVVDTARDASIGGSYRGLDPFGLFWSADVTGRFDWSVLTPLRVTLHAASGSQTVDASYTRAWLGPGVREAEIREPGVVGRLYLPDNDAGAPAAVLLTGSDGGLGPPWTAALLASHGVAALALAHWNFPGLPDVMRELDVELVGAACDWLRAQRGVRDEKPTVIGSSRGGELALLAGALLPDSVGSVVSLVGSGVPWGAFGEGVDVNETAYKFGGQPVPQLHEDEEDRGAALDDPEQVAAAEIPVERCSGDVLLLSGEDDRMWPSARLSRIAADRAEREGVADRVTAVAYPDAGHLCCLPPGFAIPTSLVHPVNGSTAEIGGSRVGNQAARRDAWPRILVAVGAPWR